MITSVLLLTACTFIAAPEGMDASNVRLSVTESGAVTLDGKPYRAVGINYLDCFSRRLKDQEDTSYEAGFAELKSYGIPFVRMMACGFYPVDWKLYHEDKERYFAILDDVVESASRHDIGMIFSFFWWYPCVPDMVGEPCSSWGDPESKTHAFMKQYVEEVVTHYRNHPAIWGWELGNEYNLASDLPEQEDKLPWVVPKFGTPEKRTVKDHVKHDDITTAVRVFAETVRKFDPLRPVTSGHAIPRASSYHLRVDRNWEIDTPDEFAKDLLDKHPDPVDLISVHIYPEAHARFFGNDYNTYDDLITRMMTVAQGANKALFLGEFGALDTEEHGGRDVAKKEHLLLLNAIEETNIPLSAIWVYDFAWQDDTINITSTNHRSYLLDELKAINMRLKNAMKD